ncbi:MULTISPECIES: hypothetical protein [unclassified Marinobacter]|uniref:hypothetical protein n=1 Tax=unclassified Marinobacter TaxID=83889 RepID=UPI00117D816C|nr:MULTISPECIES: hypothetical protein [unclassified Marinobacter]
MWLITSGNVARLDSERRQSTTIQCTSLLATVPDVLTPDICGGESHMPIRNDAEAEELEWLKTTANRASKAYRSGFGRCVVYRSDTLESKQSAEALQTLLSEEEGIECFVDPIQQQTPALPDRNGNWIIDNANALNDFPASAWLKTALDIHQPELRFILATDTRPQAD